MTLSDIATKARSLTGTDSTTYTNANLLIDINLWQHKIVTMIMGSQDESDFDDNRNTTFPNKTTPMVSGQRDYGIPVSEKVIAIKRVDITYDGVNWVKAEPIDSSEIPFGIGTAGSTQETTLDGKFSKSAPRYDSKNNSVLIYPRANDADVTAGAKIRIEWSREMNEITLSELTTGTVVPGFDSAFHPMLAYGPAFEYSSSKLLPQKNDIFAVLQDYEVRLIKAYGSKQKDRDYQLKASTQNYK